MTKGSIHQKILRILSVYAPESRAPRYMMQKLIPLQGVIQDSIQRFQYSFDICSHKTILVITNLLVDLFD